MSDIYSDDVRLAPAEALPTVTPGIRRAAGAALFLLLVLGMAIWAYRLGTRDAAEIPIIRAMEVPPRVQPAEPGGLQAAHQGLEVNSVLAGTPPPPVRVDDAPPRLAMPSVTLREEDGPQGELIVALPDVPTGAPPEEGEDLRMPQADDPAGNSFPRPVVEALAGETTGEEPAEEVTALIQSLDAAGLAEATAEAVDPGPRPRVRPQGHVVRRTAQATEPAFVPAAARAEVAPPTAPAPAAAAQPAPPTEVTRLNPGTRLVQLGAFDGEGMARQTWNQIVARHGDLLGAKSLYLERATHNARVFYRLRVAGFQNADQTRILCEQLRGRGVDCIPVTLN